MAEMPPTDPHAEHALLARLKNGDEGAFTALYRRHKDAIYRFALLYCGAAAMAADVTQETFMHLISRPGQFDPTRGSVGSWLCGVARNIARRHMGEAREETRDPAVLQDDLDALPSLVELETPERPSEYRVGLHNFYVLTRYNRSAFYASAVHDLARELRKAQVLGK